MEIDKYPHTQEATIKGYIRKGETMPIHGHVTIFKVGTKTHRFLLRSISGVSLNETLIHYGSGTSVGSTNNLIGYVGPAGKFWPLSRHDRAGILISKVSASYGPVVLSDMLDAAKQLNH